MTQSYPMIPPMPPRPVPTNLPERTKRLRSALQEIEAGHFSAARDDAVKAVAEAPTEHIGQLLLGLALGGLGRPRAAAAFLHRARRPGFRHPVYDLVALLPNRRAVAVQYQEVLRYSPQDIGLRRATAEALTEAGDPRAALEVLAQGSEDAAAMMLAGIAQFDLGAMDTALDLFRKAAEMAPADPGPWSNTGMVLKVCGRIEESLAAYDRALTVRPDDTRVRFNRAVALLYAGRLSEAWVDFERRMDLRKPRSLQSIGSLMPTLDTFDVAGSSVLVTHEEGFGDTLQFVRYVPLLARRGARVLLAVPMQLASLMERVEGVAAVIRPIDQTPRSDWHCPMLSLPRAFGTSLETIPAEIPYLTPNPTLVARWVPRLPPRDGSLRVGLVWTGQARPWADGFSALDARRSIDPALLAPLAQVPGMTFVSLQKDARARPPFPVHDVMDGVGNFDDTAAIISDLDVVVSVDTSVVHLAGGLGKPVLMLDRFDNCWRWMHDRTDSPWYPHLRIFRQKVPGDWGPAVADVAAALAQLRLPG